MIALLQRPLWRAFFFCIPLWFIFDNFILAAITALLSSMLIGMVIEIRRANQRQKQQPPRSPSP